MVCCSPLPVFGSAMGACHHGACMGEGPVSGVATVKRPSKLEVLKSILCNGDRDRITADGVI